MKKLMKCVVCGKYTLSNIHCNKPTISPHPVASGVEKNIRERLKMRLQNLEKKELERVSSKPLFLI
jgi:rRNA maturation protein Nop10